SLYQALLDGGADQMDLWPGFIDAAAGSEELTDAQLALAARIAERKEAKESEDPSFLTRLAWVLLQKSRDPATAQTLSKRAVTLGPKAPALRRELVGVLIKSGLTRMALQMYDGLPLELEDRYRLVNLYAAEKNFAEAERQCRLILSERLDDRRALKLLA